MSNVTFQGARTRGWWPMAEWLSMPPEARPPFAVRVDDLGYIDPEVIVGGAIRAAVDAALGRPDEDDGPPTSTSFGI